MLGWSKILRAKKLDEKATARALEAIERNANSQVQLIEDILDVSRIIRGQLRLNLSPVNLITVVEAALEAVRPLADTKNMTINTVLDYTLSPVSGDFARLQQIVWNLLTNAIKFTPKEGQVEIRLEGINGELSDDLTHAQIQVIDTGVGIASEFLPKVFERFRQADSTTTRSHNGLGLGLAIVRHLVELHNGTILAESPGVGKGATFTVRFPLIQENRETRPTPTEKLSGDAANSSPLAGLKVLIVDDETDTRNFLGFLFEEYGAISSTSASVETALAVIEQLKPDILISDIGMAEQDGYSLIRKLRSLPPEQGGKIPAIALTAYSREEDRQQIIEAGFQHHLSKPIDPNKLISVVASIFHLSPALSGSV